MGGTIMRKNMNFDDDLYKRIAENAKIFGNDVNKEVNMTLYCAISHRTKKALKHQEKLKEALKGE